MSFGKFLAIFFMCHQRPERSFFFKGKQFPICARCTGILVGLFSGIILAAITRCSHYIYFPLLILPMLADGIIQQKTSYESTNTRRFITGLLGGTGIIYIFINIHMFTLFWVRIVVAKLLK